MKAGRKKYDRQILVAEVALLRIQGYSTHNILEKITTENNISRKIAYDVLQDAQKYIMEQTNEDFKISFSDAISRLEEIYQNGDNKIKLEVQKEINKLRGLYATEKIDITVDYKAKFPGFKSDV